MIDGVRNDFVTKLISVSVWILIRLQILWQFLNFIIQVCDYPAHNFSEKFVKFTFHSFSFFLEDLDLKYITFQFHSLIVNVNVNIQFLFPVLNCI